MDTRYVGCDNAGHISKCTSLVLALRLSWFTTSNYSMNNTVLPIYIQYNFDKNSLSLQNERKLLTFYVPKFFIVGMLWLSAVTLATWQKYNELQDPTYNHSVDTKHYYVSINIIQPPFMIYLLYVCRISKCFSSYSVAFI